MRAIMNNRPSLAIGLICALATLWSLTVQADLAKGKIIATKSCVACHKAGVMGAPKLGAKSDWQPRVDQGGDVLVEHALKGFNSMPARGGNPDLGDNDIIDAIGYMLDTAGLTLPEINIKPATAKPAAVKAAMEAAGSDKTASSAAATTTTAKPVVTAKQGGKFKFNRLMKTAADHNPPPVEDGIHDSENDGTYQLQPPREGMAGFAKSISGNYVDWVKTLNDGTIEPRFDRLDPRKQPFIMDLNIVREVKGSMPDVVYPHKQHTQWLDCSNCHPDIFVPKKGANQISMAAILMGEKCGVCHGKVAFPVTECKRCHSKSKKTVTFEE